MANSTFWRCIFGDWRMPEFFFFCNFLQTMSFQYIIYKIRLFLQEMEWQTVAIQRHHFQHLPLHRHLPLDPYLQYDLAQRYVWNSAPSLCVQCSFRLLSFIIDLTTMCKQQTFCYSPLNTCTSDLLVWIPANTMRITPREMLGLIYKMISTHNKLFIALHMLLPCDRSLKWAAGRTSITLKFTVNSQQRKSCEILNANNQRFNDTKAFELNCIIVLFWSDLHEILVSSSY